MTTLRTVLLASLVLGTSRPVQGSDIPLLCSDPGADLMPIEILGRDNTFRAFYRNPIRRDASGRILSAGITTEWVLLHCPSGQFVKVTGFVPYDAFGNRMRPVTADDIRRDDAISGVTEKLFGEASGLVLSEVPALYEAEGLQAEHGTGMRTSCACTEY